MIPHHFPSTALIATRIAAALLASGAFAQPAYAASGSVSDFRLPEGRPSPTPAPQGQVAPDLPGSQVPQGTPAPAPAPTSTPVPTPAPVPTSRATPSAAPAPLPIRLPQVRATPAPVPSATTPSAAATATSVTAEPTPLATPDIAEATVATSPPFTEDGAESRSSGFALGPALLALLGGLAVVVALGTVAWLRRSRSAHPRSAAVPVIERPRPAQRKPADPARTSPADDPAPAATPAPPVSAPTQDMLAMDLVPVQMAMTLVNAALSWKLEVANHSGAVLDGVEVAIDMISAHKGLGEEERTSGPDAVAQIHRLGPLQPGGALVLDGVVRLPFPAIVPIWHGETALLMPMVRLRVTAAGIMPVTRVVLVGQPSPRDPATLQPFRLDLGPRIYPDLARRAFA